MKKIGIFSGTFDPVHNGHLAFAEAAISTGLDKVYFLVEPTPRRKQGVRALEHRREMVRLAIKDNPRLGSIIFEKSRLTPKDSLPELQNRFTGAEIHLLFGDDVIAHMIEHLAEWPHVEEIAKSAKLIIAARNHRQKDLAYDLDRLHKNHGLPFDYKFIEPNTEHISSSSIRLQFKKNLHPSDMPAAAAYYAHKFGLYSAA
jgi:nicotinate-nucleotide adenylyltransferase